MLKYIKNLDYFKIIDNEEKAYFLGLLYADGTITHHGFSISLVEKDEKILQIFNKSIRETGELYSTTNKFNNNIKILNIYSQEISKDLQDLGCFKNKTFTIKYPTDKIPKELQHHFIRGYFDGDGSIWNGKSKIMKVKDSSKKLGYRYKKIHNVKFNISSNIDFLLDIQHILCTELSFNYTKIGTKKGVDIRYGQLEYSGRKQAFKFYNWLYKDATIYFKRKKDKFNEIFCANI